MSFLSVMASHVRRSVGSRYTGSDGDGPHPTKLAINGWLAQLAAAAAAAGRAPAPALTVTAAESEANEAATSDDEHWAFILETSALATVKALERHGCPPPADLTTDASATRPFSRVRCVVPNPDADELGAMRGLGVNHAVDATSHMALDLLSKHGGGGGNGAIASEEATDERAAGTSVDSGTDNSSGMVGDLVRAGWRGVFSFVWLDYCGTWTSRAGRARQADLVKLFEHGMLNSRSAVLAVTISQRGAAELYEQELVDSLVMFVQEAARVHQPVRVSAAASVGSHRHPHTIAAHASRPQPLTHRHLHFSWPHRAPRALPIRPAP